MKLRKSANNHYKIKIRRFAANFKTRDCEVTFVTADNFFFFKKKPIKNCRERNLKWGNVIE